MNEFNKASTHDPNSSGSVLIPLLEALGWRGSRQKLKESLSRASTDFSLTDLIETLSNLKFQHHGLGFVKGKDIQAEWLPLVIEQGNEQIVVIKMDSENALIYDGSAKRYLSRSITDIKGNAHFFKHQEAWKVDSKNWFLQLLLKFDHSFKQVIGLTFLMTILDLLIPAFIVLIYGIVAQSDTSNKLILTGVGILIYFVAYLAFAYIRTRITDYISTRMGMVISDETYTHLLYLPPSYTETATVNSQINRIKDFENLKRFVTGGMFLKLLDLAFVLIYLIIIFILGGALVAIPVIAFLVVFGLGFAFRPIYNLKMEDLSDKSNDKQQLLMEVLKNSDRIKNQTVKQKWQARFKTLNADQIFSKLKLNEYVSLTNNISLFITNVSALVFIYGGVLQVFHGELSMGVFIGLLMLYWKVTNAINGAFSLFVQFNGLYKSVLQINRFMNLPQDTQIDEGKKPVRPMKGNVIFKEVSIRYNSDAAPALVNLSFSVSPGTMFGISGHDGGGKTTVLKLILGMYTPQVGRILIDGMNIRQLEPLSLRQFIGYSDEKDAIFSGTVKENFLDFCPDATVDQLQKLLEDTGFISEMKSLGLTLDSSLDETEIDQLPAGFVKQFNLVRMLFRSVKLYLIDEPENHLSIPQIEHYMNYFRKKAREENATFIFATKSNLVLSYCQNSISLNQGRLVNDVYNGGVLL